MKRKLKNILRLFFNLKTINSISINIDLTQNRRWEVYKIQFYTRYKVQENKVK